MRTLYSLVSIISVLSLVSGCEKEVVKIPSGVCQDSSMINRVLALSDNQLMTLAQGYTLSSGESLGYCAARWSDADQRWFVTSAGTAIAKVRSAQEAANKLREAVSACKCGL